MSKSECAHKAISLERGSFNGSDDDLGIICGNEGVYGVVTVRMFWGVVGEKKSSEVALSEFNSATNQVWKRANRNYSVIEYRCTYHTAV
jgi:hypothetical protein